jgi:DNA-binding XRE family transcriptional regulator
MSQAHLAGLLHVSSNYIYMIEAGRRLPSFEFCLRFAALFSINPPWIKSIWLRDYITHIEYKVKDRLERAHLSAF